MRSSTSNGDSGSWAQQQLTMIAKWLVKRTGARRAGIVALRQLKGSEVTLDVSIDAASVERLVARLPSSEALASPVRSRVALLDATPQTSEAAASGDHDHERLGVIVVTGEDDVRGAVLLDGLSPALGKDELEGVALMVEGLLAAALGRRETELGLSAHEASLRSAAAIVVYLESTREIVFASATAHQLLAVETAEKIDESLVPEELDGKNAIGCELVHRIGDFEEKTYQVKSRVVSWLGQRVVVARLSAVSERSRTVQLRLQLNDRAMSFAESVDGLWEWNVATNTAYFSTQWAKMLGYEPQDIGADIGSWLQIVHPEDRDRLIVELSTVAHGGVDSFNCEYRLLAQDGRYLWMHGRGLAHEDLGRGVRIVAGAQTDITERKLVEQRLWVAAHYDGMTNLPNRALLIDRIGRCLVQQQRRPEARFALIFIDLDQFKAINDNLGHHVGDRVLASVARRLEMCVRDCDTLARIGGDEFTVLLVDVERPSDVLTIAERISRALGEPLVVSGHAVNVRGSMGIAFSDGSYRNAEELLRDADTAMYTAKASGGGTFAIHDATKNDSGIRQALQKYTDDGGLQLVYEPIVCLRDRSIVALKASLGRKGKEQASELDAGRFSVVETSRLGALHGERLLKSAVLDFASWRGKLPKLANIELTLAVSAAQLLVSDFGDDLQGIAAEAGLPLDALRVEISETSIVRAGEAAERALENLHDHGVRLWISHFGSGLSALPLVHRLPLDGLKVAADLVAMIGTRGEHALKAVLEMARALGLATAAPEVERAAQAEWLAAHHCDRASGAFFSERIAHDELGFLLERG